MRGCIVRFAVFVCLLVPGLAEEGMWPPEQLPAIGKQLKAAGLELDPNQLTSLTGYPMNAVVSLGGCSASFVSPKGLVITNHHCAYGSIQYNSTADRNLLAEGFLAHSTEEELPAAPGSRVYVTVEFKDVTDQVLADLPETLSGLERYKQIERHEKEIVAACEKEPGYRCRVASYYGGLRFTMVRQLEIRDVRLVYAPPSGIGKFGGDIDNWMWPRQTGDYSFYRAYVGANGGPADYSKDNVPYQPRHYLKVSPEGVKPGDFVMVAGYPGSTGRYRLAVEVKNTFEWGYPVRTEVYRDWLKIIEDVTRDKPEAAIKYASLESGLNNVLKNNEGMLDGFAKSNMVEEKERLESGLVQWINADPGRRKEFDDIHEKLVREIESANARQVRDFYYGLAGRSSLLSAARTLYKLAKERTRPDLDRDMGFQERDISRIRQSMEAIDRRFDPAVDRAVFEHFVLEYGDKVPERNRVEAFDRWFDLGKGGDADEAVSARLAGMYSKTKLTDAKVRLGWIDRSTSDFESSDDPFIQLAVRLYPADEALQREEEEQAGREQLLRSRYMAALLEYLRGQGKEVYPDANGTLRVTYGTIKGYTPRDAVFYEPFTTIRGVLEKDTGKEPFDTPPAALKAMKDLQGGRYVVSFLNSVPVNFLSTVDTTGGNSGSPTLNGKGELVGLLFDGNYESMISDWDFLPQITRSIHVDIRYVLWLMTNVDHADWLLKEMGVPVKFGE